MYATDVRHKHRLMPAYYGRGHNKILLNINNAHQCAVRMRIALFYFYCMHLLQIIVFIIKMLTLHKTQITSKFHVNVAF